MPLNRAAQTNWRQKRRSCHDGDQSQYFSLVCFAITGWLVAAVPPGQICSRPLSPRHPGRVEEATRRATAGRRGWRRGRGREGARAAAPLRTRVQRERGELLKEPDSSGSRQSHGGTRHKHKTCRTHAAIVLCPRPLPLCPPSSPPVFVSGSWSSPSLSLLNC